LTPSLTRNGAEPDESSPHSSITRNNKTTGDPLYGSSAPVLKTLYLLLKIMVNLGRQRSLTLGDILYRTEEGEERTEYREGTPVGSLWLLTFAEI
jgi:hypothetical protein